MSEDKNNKTLAFIFPGQGSQSLGMLSGIAAEYPIVESLFSEASEILGYDLWNIIQHGPDTSLNKTSCTQPAMLVSGLAIWEIWKSCTSVRPAFMAGHSLGEYTALVAAGSIQFKDAVEIVRRRGELMQSAVPEDVGAMAAVLGLDDKDIVTVCSEAQNDDLIVSAVNFNAPGQVVIAGHKAAVEKASELARDAGARRVIPIPVSAPSHCELMHPAADELASLLQETEVSTPAVPVLHNIDAQSRDQGDEIREALIQQLYSPVRWSDTIRALAEKGVEKFVECGPGRVLAGLNRRIDRRLGSMAVYDPDSLQTALGELNDD